MKKRIIALAAALVLTLSLTGAAHAAEGAAPDAGAKATREYTIAALAEAAGLGAAEAGLERFSDAGAVSEQYREGVAKAVAAGVVKGYADGSLRLQEPVSRVEALVLLSRCLPELEKLRDAASFSDVPAWASADLARLSAAGLISGQGGVLGARETITAEEVRALAYRASGKNLLGAIFAANSTENIYSRHPLLFRHEELLSNGKAVAVTEVYASADCAYYEFGSPENCAFYSPEWILKHSSGDAAPYVYFMPPEDAEAELKTNQQFIIPYPGEKLYSVVEQDGELIARTRVTDADNIKWYIAENKETYGERFTHDYNNIDYLEMLYRLDAKNLDVNSLRETLYLTDGSAVPVSDVSAIYDRYDPIAAAKAGSLAPAFDDAAETWKLTVVYANGTPEEQVCEFTARHSLLAYVSYHDSFPLLYEDPEYTRVFPGPGPDGASEYTVYVKPFKAWQPPYDADDYEAALPLLEEAAAAGDAEAEACLAEYLLFGYGTEPDPARAFELALKAANAGEEYGCYLAALCYDQGTGVEQDYAKALEYYTKSAEHGFSMAMGALGYMYETGTGVEQDYAKALEWYIKQSAYGDPVAMATVGDMYHKGEGTEQDSTKAMEWYQKAAERGNAIAMYNVGYLYNVGDGAEQDYAKAMEWYLKSAKLGFSNAMNNIGRLYAFGYGVELDYTKAMEWFVKAAALDNPVAVYNIGNCYEEGHAVEQDYAKALEYYSKSAEMGYGGAMMALGGLYHEGKGVEKNEETAAEWLRKALAADYAPDEEDEQLLKEVLGENYKD